MTLAPGLARTGPAEALLAAAGRLGLRLERDAVLDRFDAHPAAGTLRALVEIAPQLGLAVRAFRSDLAGLAGVPLPAIVHVVDPRAEASGFGVLVGRPGGGLAVADGADGETLTFRGDEFERVWSGIVVTVERLQPGEAAAPGPRHGSPRMRLAAWYRRATPLERAAQVARGAAAVLLALLLVVSGRALGVSLGSPVVITAGAWLGAALAAVALAASVALFHRSRRSVVPGAAGSRLASTICGEGDDGACLGVLSSKFARVLGIDWGSIGVAWFGSLLALLALGVAAGPQARLALFVWVAIATLLAVPASLAFLAVQVWPLRRFCPLCNTVHAAEIAAAALALAFLWAAPPLPVATLARVALLHAAVVVGAFGLVVPLLELRLESKVNRARLGWIGATPWGALAETAGRPRAAAALPEAPIRVGAGRAPFRLDALVHPMCSGCGPVVTKLRDVAARHGDTVSIGLHIAPRDPRNPADPAFCAALCAVGLAAGGGRGMETFLRVKDAPWQLFEQARRGVEPVLAHLMPGSDIPPEILARARRSVDEATRLARELERGTPTLLLNGRFWDGGVEDLDALLSRHADLLAEVVRARPPA